MQCSSVATECHCCAVAGFLRERGGKARNSDFMERFRAVFPEEPAGKAAARSRFKSLVDDIAFGKAESGVKFVCLRRKFRGSPVFALPGPAQSSAAERVYTGQAESEGPSPEGLQEAEHISVSSGGSQDRRRQADEGEDDAVSLSGSEGSCSPRGSRRRFIQVMMSSSPQVRRSVVLHGSLCPSSRSDSDTLSLVSSNLDEDRTSATLDPLEHEWMMCASDGEWDNMQRLLSAEPSLVLRRDFVTGFTCLHWAAKQGKPELLALIINFSRRHDVPISVDVRSSSGYTPLHIAAMHGHAEVLKLLAGAYNADVEIRDYSGKRACQYLRGDVSADLRDIIGAHGSPESTDRRDGARSRFSKVLQSNLRPLRLLGPNDGGPLEAEAGPWDKVVRRKSSFSRMRPKLERLRMRTSQIVHSTTFRDTEELEGPLHGSFRRRPKTHFFG
uniref:SOWAHA-C winged helix-turn-helix domain-containing protein n=1 Tax=Mola mola TaxID=94237 RepID=A0A3Q3W8N6_MOLML